LDLHVCTREEIVFLPYVSIQVNSTIARFSRYMYVCKAASFHYSPEKPFENGWLKK